MSDPNRPGDVPPDLPPEYAEAYRRGYERAYSQRGEDVNVAPDPAAGQATSEFRALFADELEPSPAPSSRGSHRAEPGPDGDPVPEPVPLPLEEQLADPATDEQPRDRPAWLVPALLAGAVVVLLLAAYGVGRVVAGSLSGTSDAQQSPDSVVIPESGSTSGSSAPSKAPQGKKYTGPTSTAAIGGATATCEAAPGVDSAGHAVRYKPSNVFDEDMTTAWRCDGDGSGQKLTVNLAETTKIGQLGLIPGYAKTDARSGVDRYAENNRITKVRWEFDDGTSIVQTFDPSPENRSMQSMRIPVVKASRVILEILDSKNGPRNTVAVSELRLGAAKG